MNTDTHVDAALRSLDAAGHMTPEQHDRAAATLETILSTPPATVIRPRRRTAIIVATAAVAAAAGAVTVLPDGPAGGRAYASWTPVPEPLTESEIALIGPECRDRIAGEHLDRDRARLVLAERRGEYAMLLYRTENPDMSGSCLAHNIAGDDDVDDVSSGAAGGSGPAQTVAGREFTQGAILDFDDASVTDGAVGPEVAGVTVRAGGLTVRGSVANGRYVAWWPGPAMTRDPSGEPRLIISYDLTLRDGTVVVDAQPTRPR
ncbi:hypothetical protein QLQ12_39490 [Actinoplanes sp. NEAU-A12]|uniref:DUF1707 domain-containing protein n=1 Tax=Actinoplanes sandaracinus TaxID=3045177 RepID=A0ABT6WY71_9ACTN|nr:hypothetical protein [Actinoplanes sandaracinus]MDI6104693.1 hypothetical protein [Actinoplanes sandaracinus]